MRIHLQSPADDPLFDFSRVMWDAAAARVPDTGEHVVTIGGTSVMVPQKQPTQIG